MIIADDFRPGIGCGFRVLPFTGGAPLAFSRSDFRAINVRFRIPRPSLRDQRIQRNGSLRIANDRRKDSGEAD